MSMGIGYVQWILFICDWMLIPGLFRREFLSLSPIWAAYEAQHILQLSYFTIHSKLLSAYLIQTNPHSSQLTQILQPYNQATTILHPSSSWDILRVSAFFNHPLVQSQQSQAPDTIYLDQLRLLSSQNSCKQVLRLLVDRYRYLCSIQKSDDLDLLMISKMSINAQLLEVVFENPRSVRFTRLSYSRLLFSFYKQITEGCQQIRSMAKIIDVFLSNYDKYCQPDTKKLNADIDYSQIHATLQTLHGFISHQTANSKLSTTSMHAILKQLCIYMNWLALKCVYSRSAEQFATNCQYFLSTVESIRRTIGGVPNRYHYYLIVWNELVTYLYRQVMSCPAQRIQQLSSANPDNKVNVIQLLQAQAKKSEQKIRQLADYVSKIKDMQMHLDVLTHFSTAHNIIYAINHAKHQQIVGACVEGCARMPIIVIDRSVLHYIKSMSTKYGKVIRLSPQFAEKINKYVNQFQTKSHSTSSRKSLSLKQLSQTFIKIHTQLTNRKTSSLNDNQLAIKDGTFLLDGHIKTSTNIMYNYLNNE